jgi:hypothetical protein
MQGSVVRQIIFECANDLPFGYMPLFELLFIRHTNQLGEPE